MHWFYDRRLWRWAGYGLLVLVALDMLLFMGNFTLAAGIFAVTVLPEAVLHILDLLWLVLVTTQGALNEVMDDLVRFVLAGQGWSDTSMGWLAWALAWGLFALVCAFGYWWVRMLFNKR